MEFVDLDCAFARSVSKCSKCEKTITALHNVRSASGCGALLCATCADGGKSCVLCGHADCKVEPICGSLKNMLSVKMVKCLKCKALMKYRDYEAHMTADSMVFRKIWEAEKGCATGEAGTDTSNAAGIFFDDLCPQAEYECIHKDRGCTFRGSATELRKHLQDECVKGYRALDDEAVRLCGGITRMRQNVDTIRQLLGRGGGSGANAPPVPPKRLEEHLRAAEIFITAKEFSKICDQQSSSKSKGTSADVVNKTKPVTKRDSTGGSSKDTVAAPEEGGDDQSVNDVNHVEVGSTTDKTTPTTPSSVLSGVLTHLVETGKKKEQTDALLADYRSVLKSRVVDTWNLSTFAKRPAPEALVQSGVKRRKKNQTQADLNLTTEDGAWRQLFYEELPEEKEPPPPPTPVRPAAPARSVTPSTPAQTPCNHFVRFGRCKFGVNCWYAHVRR
ncbi:unnamed protein product [Amoebophrya sp. A25]|nr:unnamed protein product [Amoebophrya sp. A25]|eukprot:GSA25T00013026001.1